MASISYKKTYDFLIAVFRKKLLLLQIPILLFVSVPFFNTFMTQDSSRTQGHLLIDKMKTGEINMTEFQQELAQISKDSAAKNTFHIPLIILLCMKIFLYCGAIVSTMIIGLAYRNNTFLIIPSRASLGRSALVIVSYFFSIALFAFPVGFTINVLNTLMQRAPLVVLIILISLVSLGFFLFLTSCFSSTIPLILDTDAEILSSIRKSYRMSKSQAVYMLAIFIAIFSAALVGINLIALILARLLPYAARGLLCKYASGLVATISVMIFIAFYQQLTSPEARIEETTNPGIMPPHGA